VGLSSLGEGTYTVSASQTDAAGNTGSSGANTFTVDTTAPTVTLSAPANNGYATTSTPTFSGTCSSTDGNVTVTVKQAGSTKQTRTATCSGGNYSVVASPALTDGAYTAQASQTDAALNTGTSGSNAFTIDTVAPTVGLTAPANNTFTSSTGPNVIGTCSAGDGTVTVVVKQAGSTVQTKTPGCSGGGGFNVGLSGLAEGTYTVSASQTDAAGNTGSSGVNSFTVDTTAPTVSGLVLSNGTGNAGTADKGDSLVITYSEAMDATKFCSTWLNDGTAQSITTTSTVTISNTGSNDTLAVTTSAGACGGAFHLGSVALGGNYVASDQTFGGNGNNNTSTITWDPAAKTLTITLGKAGGGTTNTNIAAAVPRYTPDTALTDRAGNAIGGSSVAGTSSRF
jgi:hypothetical protein